MDVTTATETEGPRLTHVCPVTEVTVNGDTSPTSGFLQPMSRPVPEIADVGSLREAPASLTGSEADWPV